MFSSEMWSYQFCWNQYLKDMSQNKWFVYSPLRLTSSGRNVMRRNNVDSGGNSSRRYLLLRMIHSMMKTTEIFLQIKNIRKIYHSLKLNKLLSKKYWNISNIYCKTCSLQTLNLLKIVCVTQVCRINIIRCE